MNQSRPSPHARRALLDFARHHRRRLTWTGLGIAGPLAGFAAISEDVAAREPLCFDRNILEWLHSHATPFLDSLMLAITTVGGEIGLVLLVAAVMLGLLAFRRFRDALFVFLAVGGAEAINLVLKAMFGRPRPSLWLSIAPETSFSYPSGHATGSVALAAAVVVLLWRTRWRVHALLFGIVFSVLVSVSRLYLGVHYPSDVIAGGAASLAWVTVLALLLRRELFKPNTVPDGADLERSSA
jgi:undecaprenyl-diphosphatase